MCGSMADIQSATAEIRRGKKGGKKPQDKKYNRATITRSFGLHFCGRNLCSRTCTCTSRTRTRTRTRTWPPETPEPTAKWRSLATLHVLYLQRAACSTFQTYIPNSHPRHNMYQSMANIQSPTTETRQWKKEEERRKSMKILWSALLHRTTIKDNQQWLLRITT